MSSFNNTQFFNRRSTLLQRVLEEEEEEMDRVMEELAEEMEFDDAVFQFVKMEQEEDEDEMERRPWGGSRDGRSLNKDRDFQGAYEKVVRDYFNGRDSLYDENDFER